MNKREIERELEALKKGLEEAQQKNVTELPTNNSIAELIRYLSEQREETNRKLGDIMSKIRLLEESVDSLELSTPSEEDYVMASGREIAVSIIDAKIIEYVQTMPRSMASAEDVRKYMNYKGNNAACARLNSLYKQKVLDRLQLGHKVYYKYDAGKATMQLIVSPPQ